MLKVGDIVLARVTGIKDYGFFVKVDGYGGLCHLSEISNDFVENVTDFVNVGDDIYVLIVGIDEKNKKLNVSIKDIYYVACDNKRDIVETRRGFLPLKEMLPVWINEKMDEYEKKNK